MFSSTNSVPCWSHQLACQKSISLLTMGCCSLKMLSPLFKRRPAGAKRHGDSYLPDCANDIDRQPYHPSRPSHVNNLQTLTPISIPCLHTLVPLLLMRSVFNPPPIPYYHLSHLNNNLPTRRTSTPNFSCLHTNLSPPLVGLGFHSLHTPCHHPPHLTNVNSRFKLFRTLTPNSVSCVPLHLMRLAFGPPPKLHNHLPCLSYIITLPLMSTPILAFLHNIVPTPFMKLGPSPPLKMCRPPTHFLSLLVHPPAPASLLFPFPSSTLLHLSNPPRT